ncbi:hypothetical protein QZH41_005924 [Actinostola sp. cb2023]|nr:hypothetical protein QZH41_005924 [Actinostola sp. cb2023]
MSDWFQMELEPLHQQQKIQSHEDEIASNILKSQTQKLEVEDRYVVPILWKNNSEPLPDNRVQAEKQWLHLEKRLDKDEKLKSAYIKTLNTDLEKGFIKKVSEEDLKKDHQRDQYIVHHPVVHQHKPDKVRRVFNFSSRYQGQSLNDRIYNGPDLLNSLTGVLTRFRTGNICLAADVSDMFLQMQVKAEDEKSLRFLFRESSDQPIETYKCVRRPLGERSAPCCANYTIKKCCEDNIKEYPLAAEIADKSFYVDDCLTSVDNQDQAKELVTDLTQLLGKGSFKLTKWMSNDKVVLQTVPPDDQYKGLKSFDNQSTNRTRTLGSVYDPDKDCFIATISPKNPASTPREFLSRIASIWDPLGHLSPFIIRGRNLQRESFTQKLHWDSLVTDPLLTKWRSWEEELLQIQGGWTMVKRTILQSKTLPIKKSYDTYDVISAFSNNSQNVVPTGVAMLDILNKMGFHQINFYCHKKSVGRVVSIMTKNNTAGQQVVRYFTDDAFAKTTFPDACGSFDRLPEDTSILAQNCAKWGKDSSGNVQVNKWGRIQDHGISRLATRPFAMDTVPAHGFGCTWKKAKARFYCDDSFVSPQPYNVLDTWRISVR